MPLPQRPVHSLNDPNQMRRDRETINNILNHQHDDSRIRTYGEISAVSAYRPNGIFPVNYAYQPTFAQRYGFSENASAAVNTNALMDALASLPVIGNGTRGGLIVLPGGEFAVEELIIPAYCAISGSAIGSTSLYYSGTDYCMSLGSATANNVNKPQCGLMNMRILCSTRTGNLVRLQETSHALVRDLYLEGYTDGGAHLSRTNIGIAVDGGTGIAGCYINYIENITINHVNVGVRHLSSGGQRSTSSFLRNVSVQGGDAVYGNSSGWVIDKGQADGSLWIGGNIEHCTKGIDPQPGTATPSDMGALGFTMIGTRFEQNALDISSASFQQPATFIGIETETEYNVSDANGIYTFLGCKTTSAGPWVNRYAAGGIPPQNAQAGAYTLIYKDAGKTVYQTVAGTITIPSNASVPFPVGTQIEIINGSSGAISIAITSDTMLLAGVGTTGTRTLANNLGKARLYKAEPTVWTIDGPGVT